MFLRYQTFCPIFRGFVSFLSISRTFYILCCRVTYTTRRPICGTIFGRLLTQRFGARGDFIHILHISRHYFSNLNLTLCPIIPPKRSDILFKMANMSRYPTTFHSHCSNMAGVKDSINTNVKHLPDQ